MKPRDRYYVKFRNIIHTLRGTGRRLNHRRIGLFWTVAAVSLTVPWAIRGCSLPTQRPVAAKSKDSCAVRSIYDGDTMTVVCAGREVKVRLYCIDAPEMGQEPWGRMSRDYLRSIIPSTVRLVVHHQDKYGRAVGEIYVDGKNVSRVMVREGMAVTFWRYCDDQSYGQAEVRAKGLRLGVWGMAGEHQSPWRWRARQHH